LHLPLCSLPVPAVVSSYYSWRQPVFRPARIPGPFQGKARRASFASFAVHFTRTVFPFSDRSNSRFRHPNSGIPRTRRLIPTALQDLLFYPAYPQHDSPGVRLLDDRFLDNYAHNAQHQHTDKLDPSMNPSMFVDFVVPTQRSLHRQPLSVQQRLLPYGSPACCGSTSKKSACLDRHLVWINRSCSSCLDRRQSGSTICKVHCSLSLDDANDNSWPTTTRSRLRHRRRLRDSRHPSTLPQILGPPPTLNTPTFNPTRFRPNRQPMSPRPQQVSVSRQPCSIAPPMVSTKGRRL